MDKSYCRNIKFLSRIVFRVLVMAAAIAAIVLLMNYAEVGKFSINTMKTELGFISGYVCIFTMLVANITIITAYMPIIFSFGSRRKDYFISKQTIIFILIIISIALNVVIDVVSNQYTTRTIVFTIAGMLVCSALSSVFGNVINRFGMAGYIIFVILCGVTGGIIGGLSGSSIIKDVLATNCIEYITLSASIVIYIAASVLEWNIVKNYELK